MKALLEKVRNWGWGKLLCWGSSEEWDLAVSLASVPLWGHPPYSFLSLSDISRYLQSSFVWTHEPWQRLMSSL